MTFELANIMNRLNIVIWSLNHFTHNTLGFSVNYLAFTLFVLINVII